MDGEDGFLQPGTLTHAEKQRRLQSAVLYQTAANVALLGFIFCAYLGFWKIFHEPLGKNHLGKEFSSGWNYFPGSVSEMANNPDEPEGMVFQAFMVLAAILYLVSGAPWNLRNIYTSGRGASRGLLFIRHLAPAYGFLTLAMVRFTSPGRATKRETFSSNIHLMGAMTGFGSYIALEVWTLAQPRNACITRAQWIFRCLTISGSVIFTIIFMISSSLAQNPQRLGLELCCDNIWRVPEMPGMHKVLFASNTEELALLLDAARAHTKGQPQLEDTARGWVLALRCFSFFCEVFMGLCTVGNMLVIYHYCEERQLVLRAELPPLGESPCAPCAEKNSAENGQEMQRAPRATARRRDATPGAPVEASRMPGAE